MAATLVVVCCHLCETKTRVTTPLTQRRGRIGRLRLRYVATKQTSPRTSGPLQENDYSGYPASSPGGRSLRASMPSALSSGPPSRPPGFGRYACRRRSPPVRHPSSLHVALPSSLATSLVPSYAPPPLGFPAGLFLPLAGRESRQTVGGSPPLVKGSFHESGNV